MKNEVPTTDTSKTGAPKTDTPASSKPVTRSAGALSDGLASRLAGVRRVRKDLPLSEIERDPSNRIIDESTEHFARMVDSVRVFGILDAAHVWQRPDRKFQLISGERRFRAATVAGLTSLPCEVWPEHVDRRDLELTGIVTNTERLDPSSMEIAKKLRAYRNQHAASHEEVAAHIAMPLWRVQNYLSLFTASDCLLEFFAEENIALETAVELMRFEKACGEVAARRLVATHDEEPLTSRRVETLRRRFKARKEEDTPETGDTEPRPNRHVAALQRAWAKDPATTRKLLEELVAKMGFRLVDAIRGHVEQP